MKDIKKIAFFIGALALILSSFSCGADGPYHYPWPPYLSTPDHPVYPYPPYPVYPPPPPIPPPPLYPPYPAYPPPPPYPYPQDHCPIGYGSVCQTFSGSCVRFVEGWSPSWFRACAWEDFFYACVNLPSFPMPFIENCQPIGSPCGCDWGYSGGWYHYEQGSIW